MKTVLDTNVLVDHFRAVDTRCSEAVKETVTRRRQVVTCEKLLREYRSVLAGGDRGLMSVIDRIIMQVFPIDLLSKFDDPSVRIDFGPPEDRFHMQLAIDAQAEYHVTKEGAILSEAAKMAEYEVRERHPERYVYELRKARK